MEASATAALSACPEPNASTCLPWLLRTLCALHRRPFDATLIEREFPPPHDESVLIHAANELGFKATSKRVQVESLAALPLPVLLGVNGAYAMLLRVEGNQAVWLPQGELEPCSVPMDHVAAVYDGRCHLFKLQDAQPADPDAAQASPSFGFRWFVPDSETPQGMARGAGGKSGVAIARLGPALVHAGHHRQGGGAPHRKHARGAGRGHGRLHPVHGVAELGAAVPDPAHGQPRRCGARRRGIQASVAAAGAVFPASTDGRRGGALQRHRSDPRVHRFGGDQPDAGPALPADRPGRDVLVFGGADAGRARRSVGHRAAVAADRTGVSRSAQPAVPAGRAQPGLPHRVRRRLRDCQEPATRASTRATLCGIPRRLLAQRLSHPADRQQLPGARLDAGAVHDASRARGRGLAGDAPGPGGHRRRRNERLHDRHAGRVPDVRRQAEPAHVANGGPLAAVPAGTPGRAAPG